MSTSNKERKELLVNAFTELVNQVIPDTEDVAISKEDALAVLTPADILSVVGTALGVSEKPVEADAPAND